MSISRSVSMPRMTLAVAAATGVLLAPGMVALPTPSALQAAIHTRAETTWTVLPAAATTSFTELLTGAGHITPVSLLGQSPALASLEVHQLAALIASPGATTPIASSDLPLLGFIPSPDRLVQGVQDLLGSLQTVLTTIAADLPQFPAGVSDAVRSLAAGKPGAAVTSLILPFTTALIDIGFGALPQLSSGLSLVFPALAGGFAQLGDFSNLLPLGAPLGFLSTKIGDGVQAVYDGVVAGLRNGNLLQAAGGFIQGLSTLSGNTFEAVRDLVAAVGVLAGKVFAGFANPPAGSAVASTGLSAERVTAAAPATKPVDGDGAALSLAPQARRKSPAAASADAADAAPSGSGGDVAGPGVVAQPSQVWPTDDGTHDSGVAKAPASPPLHESEATEPAAGTSPPGPVPTASTNSTPGSPAGATVNKTPRSKGGNHAEPRSSGPGVSTTYPKTEAGHSAVRSDTTGARETPSLSESSFG